MLTVLTVSEDGLRSQSPRGIMNQHKANSVIQRRKG
jgi:hypothetical protein